MRTTTPFPGVAFFQPSLHLISFLTVTFLAGLRLTDDLSFQHSAHLLLTGLAMK